MDPGLGLWKLLLHPVPEGGHGLLLGPRHEDVLSENSAALSLRTRTSGPTSPQKTKKDLRGKKGGLRA